jgi:Protein of unknown function DUF58
VFTRPKLPAEISRILRLLRRAWGYVPLSAPGTCLVFTIAAGTYYFGKEQTDYVLLITGGALLSAALVDALVVIATACYLGYCFRKQGEAHFQSGHRLKMMTGVQTLSGRCLSPILPPLIEASTSILNPPYLDCEWKRNPLKQREEWLTSQKRCLLEENFRLRRRIIVKDVLGFSALDWEQEEPVSLVVMPKPLPMQAQSVLRARFTGDDIPDPRGEPKGDRVDMRRYSPGDPPRLLLWKIYARTGKLMVRVPEAAITSAPRTCAYLVGGPDDEMLASVARTIVEANLLGQGWWFGADGSERSVDKQEQALQLIARSGNPGTETGKGLSAFLSKAAGEGFGSCLVLVPPTDGDWVEKVAGSISRSPIAITLLTVGSAAPKEQEPKWKRWVFYEEKRKTDPSELLARLNSSTVTDWLTFESETRRLIPLRVGAQGTHRS